MWCIIKGPYNKGFYLIPLEKKSYWYHWRATPEATGFELPDWAIRLKHPEDVDIHKGQVIKTYDDYPEQEDEYGN